MSAFVRLVDGDASASSLLLGEEPSGPAGDGTDGGADQHLHDERSEVHRLGGEVDGQHVKHYREVEYGQR